MLLNRYTRGQHTKAAFLAVSASSPRSAKFYDCGICGALHPLKWDGDCREDAMRFADDELDQALGVFGWQCVDMPGGEG